MGFLDEISKNRGQPAIVRIGIVTNTNPLEVTVQGTVYSDFGVINGVAPFIGSVVALLGQSSVSADGSSWLMLGTIISSTIV